MRAPAVGALTHLSRPNRSLAMAVQPVDRSRWIARLSWHCSRHEHLSKRQMAILLFAVGRCRHAS
jgi:hypothetical protein